MTDPDEKHPVGRDTRAQSKHDVQGDSASERGGAPRPRAAADEASTVSVAPPAAYSDASLHCEDSFPGAMLASSVEAGWTSLMVEQRSAARIADPFETGTTPDHRISVLLKGDLAVKSFRGGVWRSAHYRAGMAAMTAGGETSRAQWTSRVATPAPLMAKLFLPQRIILETAEHYRAAGQRWNDAPLSALAFDDPAIAHATLALLRAMRAGAPDLYAETLVHWLATHLLSHHSGWLVLNDVREPGPLADRQVARVVELMSAHLAEPLTLDRLAAEAGISKFHFARRFRTRTGTTPHGYLLELRLDAGRRLLATSDDNVAQVALAVGFANAAHFGSAFRRRFGETPTAFRRRIRA